MATTRDEYYGVLLASFFDGPTGQALQASKSKDAMILATFLIANRFANMIGLYEISLSKIGHTLTIVSSQTTIRRALKILGDLRFAFYDPATEFVWVREMARVRMNLTGVPIHQDDKRRLGAVKLYANLPINPYLGPFYDRYVTELKLPKRREGLPLPLSSGSEGAYQGAYQGPTHIPSEQQDQDVQNQSVQRSDLTETERTAASPQLGPETDPDPHDNYAVITAVVTKDILPRRLPDHLLLTATLTRCHELDIACDGETARKAVDSALFRYYRQARLDGDLPPDPRGIYHDHLRPGGATR